MTPVLIVDGEPLVRSYLKRLLSRNGFEILEAHDGPSAISVIRQFGGNVAAVISDVEINVMGVALAEAVMQAFPDIPLLLMSALPITEEDLRRDVPRCVLVEKPFEPNEFVKSLRSLLERSQKTKSAGFR